MPIAIRHARAADALAIARVHHAAIHALKGGPYSQDVIDRWAPPIDPERAAALFAHGEQEGDLQLVAERDGNLLGFIVANVGTGEVHACYVAPEAVGEGTGRALIEAVVAAAAGRAKNLDVRSSLNAEPFYTAVGFVRTALGQSRFEDGTTMPVVFMRRPLG